MFNVAGTLAECIDEVDRLGNELIISDMIGKQPTEVNNDILVCFVFHLEI